jgi:hypothetical protein
MADRISLSHVKSRIANKILMNIGYIITTVDSTSINPPLIHQQHALENLQITDQQFSEERITIPTTTQIIFHINYILLIYNLVAQTTITLHHTSKSWPKNRWFQFHSPIMKL